MKRVIVLGLLALLPASGVSVHGAALYGPPGSGKSTQAHLLGESRHLFVLEPHQLVRRQVKAETELGKQAAVYLKAGQAVSDDLQVAMVKAELAGHSDYLLDAFPRSVAQARQMSIDSAVVLEVSDSVVQERLALKRDCPKCGRSYNLRVNPPRQAGRCDNDGTELVHLDDDLPEAVSLRLRAYHHDYDAVLAFYRELRVLHEVDGTGSVQQVSERLLHSELLP